MRSPKQWMLGRAVKTSHTARSGDGGWIVYASMADRGVCPGCKRRSRHLHGWRERRLQDFATQGEPVTICLRVRRWRCTQTDCDRQTFSDQLSKVASPYARRTRRAAQIASLLGYSAGGRPGERVMHRLGMPISNDTILRALKREAEATVPPAKIIGIDDWSWRKGFVANLPLGRTS